MAFFSNDDNFTEKISKNFDKFGINTESIDKSSNKNVLRFNMNDTIHNTKYIAYAIKSSNGKKSAELWDKIIENDLIPAAASADEEVAGALIIPSSDIDYVLSMASKKYLTPTIYQLFDGYVIAGFQKNALSDLVDKFNKEDDNNTENTINTKSNDKVDNDNKNNETTKNDKNNNISNIKEDLEEVNNSNNDNTDKIKDKNNQSSNKNKPGSLKKKLIAAAILGTSLAMMPLATDTIIENLQKDNEPVKEEETPKRVTNNYFEGIKNGFPADPEILSYIASNPQTSQQELEDLANTPVGMEVLKNPSSPIDILEDAANSIDESKREAVAENPSLSTKTLNKLSNDESEKVRKSLAKNPAISKNIMKRLSKDTDDVRESLLENSMLSADMLDDITNGLTENCDFNKKLMSNPCINPELLEYNADNPDACIREGIASNPKTPKHIIDKLSNDNLPSVRNAAWKNPNISSNKLNSLFEPNWYPDSNNPAREDSRKSALENPSINDNTIRKAALVAPKEYGLNLAKNPKTPSSILSDLKNLSNGKGGLKKFIDDSQIMKTDPNIKENILNEAKKYNNNPEIPLRKQLNSNFIKDVYNPFHLIEDMKKYPITKKLTPKNNNYTNDSLNNSIDYSIDTPQKTMYSLDNIDNLPNRFSDLEIPEQDNNSDNQLNPEAQKAVFNVADKIIDNVMADVLPAYTGSNNSLLNNKDNNVNTPNPSQINNNNLNLGNNFSALSNQPINTYDKPIWLFENSCKHIDELESMF